MRAASPTYSRLLALFVCVLIGQAAGAQEPWAAPAYLAVVEGTATVEREGEVQAAVRDMPFVPGDRLRTEAGRVEIVFPDGSAIEVGSYSEVEAISPTRVRLLAGTIDHLPSRAVRSDSASYLPQDLRSYGSTFDSYGSWNYDTRYGYVRYPRVAAEWRPYYYGTWSSVPSHGWTWIGLDAWSWPTHHYGRWGYARNAWFWIPGRAWSGGWVAWGVSPGYVSWCPLGSDGRPVFALSAGVPNGGWPGWTVMAREEFGHRDRYAHRYAVDPHRFDARTPFVQTTRLPLTIGPERKVVENRGRGDQGRAPSAASRTDPRRSTPVVPAPKAGGGTSIAPPGYTPAVPPVAPVVSPIGPVVPIVIKPAAPSSTAPVVPPGGAQKVSAPEYGATDAYQPATAGYREPPRAAPRDGPRGPERAAPAERQAGARRARRLTSGGACGCGASRPTHGRNGGRQSRHRAGQASALASRHASRPDSRRPQRRHRRAVHRRRDARHPERRAVRLRRRPAAGLRARQLLAEHDHARLRGQRPGDRRVRDAAPRRRRLRRHQPAAAPGDHRHRGRRVRSALRRQHLAHLRRGGRPTSSSAAARRAPAR